MSDDLTFDEAPITQEELDSIDDDLCPEGIGLFRIAEVRAFKKDFNPSKSGKTPGYSGVNLLLRLEMIEPSPGEEIVVWVRMYNKAEGRWALKTRMCILRNIGFTAEQIGSGFDWNNLVDQIVSVNVVHKTVVNQQTDIAKRKSEPADSFNPIQHRSFFDNDQIDQGTALAPEEDPDDGIPPIVPPATDADADALAAFNPDSTATSGDEEPSFDI